MSKKASDGFRITGEPCLNPIFWILFSLVFSQAEKRNNPVEGWEGRDLFYLF